MKYSKLLQCAAAATIIAATVGYYHVSPIRYRGIEVIDGDTFRHRGEVYRLWGIDAPERDQTCLDSSFRRYDCGKQATEKLKSLLNTEEEPECVQVSRDSYDRKVMKCYVYKQDLGGMMVRSGHALDEPFFSGGVYGPDQEAAKKEKLGLHVGPYLSPLEYRRLREPRIFTRN